MSIKEKAKLNNQGLSLVELIIAISIGVIVSGAIAALITFSLRMYNNENVNASMQYELQTNINMMMDEIMGASALVVEQNTGSTPGTTISPDDTGIPYTKYALFGNPNVIIKVGSVYKKYFKGVIFVSSPAEDGKFKVYMKEVDTKAAAVAMNTTIDLKALASSAYDDVDDYFPTPGTTVTSPYLLGENVTQFVMIPDPDGHFDSTNKTYDNPIGVKVELQFEKNGWGEKEYKKHVREYVYTRNQVEVPIFIKDPNNPAYPDPSEFMEFKLKRNDNR